MALGRAVTVWITCVIILTSTVNASNSQNYPIVGDIAPCDKSNCKYCCVKYPEFDFPVCSDDILRCHLKKIGKFEDIKVLGLVLALSLFGLPFLLTVLRCVFFTKIYRELSFLGLGIRWARFFGYLVTHCKKPPKSFYKNVTLYTQQSLTTQSNQNNSSSGGRNASNPKGGAGGKGLGRQGTGKGDPNSPLSRSKTVRKRTKKRSILFDAESEEEEVEVNQQNNDTDFFAHLSDGLSDDSDYPPDAYAFVRPNQSKQTKGGGGSQHNSPARGDGMLGMMHEEVMMEDEDDD